MDRYGPLTRQAYYEAVAHEKKTSIADMVVLALVHKIRKDMPLIGTRKLFYLLEPELKGHGI